MRILAARLLAIGLLVMSIPAFAQPMVLGYPIIGHSVDRNDASQFTAIRVSVSTTSPATEAAIYVGHVPAGGTSVSPAIYANSSGRPGQLVWGGPLVPVTATGWARVPVPSVQLGAGTYWIGFNATADQTGFSFDPATSRVLYQQWWSTPVGQWPTTAPPATNGIQPYNYSITLTIGGGAVTPTTTPTAGPTMTPNPPTVTPTVGPTTTPTVAPTAVTGSLPPQGLYESCLASSDACLNDLNTMAAAGFRVVVNYDQFYASAAQQLAYADRAGSLGMGVIWGMSDPVWRGTGNTLRSYYSDMAATCGCSDNAGFIAYTVNLVKNHPATWGYYIGDEATTNQHASVLAFSNTIHSLDPVHPRLYVSGEDTSSVGNNLRPFVDTCDICGSDVYPIGVGNPSPQNDPISNVGAVERAITGFGKPTAMVLQSFKWQESWVPNPRWPTRAEERTMRDLALSNGHPAVLLWYSYFDILRADGNRPGQHWADVVAAALGP